MARPSKAPFVVDAPAMDAGAVRRDLAALDNLSAARGDVVAQIREEFGVELPPFDSDLYWRNVNFLTDQAGELLLQQGVWLIALKEALPHGTFAAEVEKRSGMSYRSAAAIMQGTRRLTTAAGKKLLSNLHARADLSRARLINFAINIPEAELEKLAEDGGEVGGYTAEDLLSMTRSELMETIRNLKDVVVHGTEQNEALEKKLKAKKAREKKEDPLDAAIREFEHAAIECAGEAAKLLRVDLTAAHKKVLDDDAAKDGLPAEGTDRINRALVDALRKVAQEIAAAAATHGLDTADLFAGEEQMPDDFE